MYNSVSLHAKNQAKSVKDLRYTAFVSTVKSLPGVPDESFGYLYDDIGNRTSSTENGTTRAYTANSLNQYTAITNPSVSPTHDGDGNMTSDGEWTYTWNADNRLIAIENATHREEYDYDYMGRRWRLKTYTKSGSAWVLSMEKRFVYDGYRQIAEFTMNGTTPVLTATYLWQPGLDGIVLRAAFGAAVRYFIPDGNRNVLQLRDATGAVTDSYAYGPFGQCASAGTTPNPFRFSCEYHDAETGLVYYNYRHYHPGLGRWTSRDPVGDMEETNLYSIVANQIALYSDWLGLKRLKLLYDLEHVNSRSNFPTIAERFGNPNGLRNKGIIYVKKEGIDSYFRRASEVIKSLDKMLKDSYDKTGEGECNCIAYIYLVQHGKNGEIRIAETKLSGIAAETWKNAKNNGKDSLVEIEISTHPHMNELLSKINGYLCEDDSTVDFVQCHAGDYKEDEHSTNGKLTAVKEYLRSFLPRAGRIVIYSGPVRLTDGNVIPSENGRIVF